MQAKMKNGATPSHCVGSRRLRASAGGAALSGQRPVAEG